MKQKLFKIIQVLLSLALCVVFGAALLTYARPMENVTLNLSLTPEGEAIDPEAFDDKGWTVFTQEGDTVTAMSPTASAAI